MANSGSGVGGMVFLPMLVAAGDRLSRFECWNVVNGFGGSVLSANYANYANSGCSLQVATDIDITDSLGLSIALNRFPELGLSPEFELMLQAPVDNLLLYSVLQQANQAAGRVL